MIRSPKGGSKGGEGGGGGGGHGGNGGDGGGRCGVGTDGGGDSGPSIPGEFRTSAKIHNSSLTLLVPFHSHMLINMKTSSFYVECQWTHIDGLGNRL